jgi:hypothetical protein
MSRRRSVVVNAAGARPLVDGGFVCGRSSASVSRTLAASSQRSGRRPRHRPGGREGQARAPLSSRALRLSWRRTRRTRALHRLGTRSRVAVRTARTSAAARAARPGGRARASARCGRTRGATGVVASAQSDQRRAVPLETALTEGRGGRAAGEFAWKTRRPTPRGYVAHRVADCRARRRRGARRRARAAAATCSP